MIPAWPYKDHEPPTGIDEALIHCLSGPQAVLQGRTQLDNVIDGDMTWMEDAEVVRLRLEGTA